MSRGWQAALLYTLAMPWVALSAPAPADGDWVDIIDDSPADFAGWGSPQLSAASFDIGFGPPSSAPPFVNSTAPQDPAEAAKKAATEAPPITIQGPAEQGPQWGGQSGEYLYVWSGAEGRQQNDRLVTLDFNPNSPNYGRIVSQAEVPTSGNEPHHCGLNVAKNRLLCGGFFSVIKKQDDIFVFDMSDPANPQFLRSTQSDIGSVNDDFIAVSDGTFILSQMGSKEGGTPGRVVKVDGEGNILGEYPPRDQPLPRGPYNPHGVALREDLNLFVTSDFLGPETALNSYNGPLGLRNTVRVWDLANMRIMYSFSLPVGTGTMDVKLMHQNPNGIGYCGGTGNNGQLWVFNTAARTAKRVIDMNRDIIPSYWYGYFNIESQMMQISPDDKYLYIPYSSEPDQFTGKSGFYSGVAVYDVTDPWNPRLHQNMAYPKYSGPHLGQLYGNRLVTAGYFLDTDDFGKFHVNGDHVVRALTVGSDGKLTPDPNFQVNFNNLIPGIELRPHGLATIKV